MGIEQAGQTRGMVAPDVTFLVRRHSDLKSQRANYNTQWQEIARYVWPDRAIFTTIKTPGIKVNDYIFDGTAAMALPRFAAALESILTPRTSRWHKLKASCDKRKMRGWLAREDINDDDQVKTYMEDLTDILFESRYGPSGNFASQMNECYMSVGAFGPGVMYIPDSPGGVLRYKAISINEMYFIEDANYGIDTFHREYQLTARQVMQEWGNNPDATVPDKVKSVIESRPDTIFKFVEVVMPRQDTGYGGADNKHMPFACYDVCLDSNDLVMESGYATCPYMVGRHLTTPGTGVSNGHVYGYSPAQLCLPDVKTLNELEKEDLRGTALRNLPPLLMNDSDVLQSFDMRPGALNSGGIDDQGRQMVIPLQIGGDNRSYLEKSDQKRRAINESFLVTLFQILVETPAMTATEALLRAQEKGQLLAPQLRLYSEMIGPQIHRELDIMGRAGRLPKPPDIMVEAGMEYEIEYVSPLIQMQRAEEGVAINRTIESAGVIAQYDPSIIKRINFDRSMKHLAEINGAPADMLNSDDEMIDIKQADAQQAQLANILAAAPVAAQTAKTLAETQQTAGQGAPPFVPSYAGGR